MKRIIILAATTLMLIASARAAEVPEATCRTAAVNFWNTYRPADSKNIESMDLLTFAGLPHLYVYVNGDDGFVVMPTDDCIMPVLAYSFDSPFPRQLHPALNYWLTGYNMQIEEAIANHAQAPAATARQWDELLTTPVPPMPKTLTAIPALLTTRWDQGFPYNDLCPFDSAAGERTVVGCVATAMAQIMRYWKHPSCGIGSNTYTPRGSSAVDRQSADFEHTTYIWNNMPNTIGSSTRPQYINAVATLSYHCGVSVNMMYGISSTGGSGAYSQDCVGAFVNNFRYDPSMRHVYRDYNDSASWINLIINDLQAGRPIYYSGRDNSGGHAFVLDGSDTLNRFHFNWGWAGYGNGFYAVDNLAPGYDPRNPGVNPSGSFNSSQSAIFGIQPVPQTFDSVLVDDTFCFSNTYFQFYEHYFRAYEDTFLLTHLDTVFTLVLHGVNSQTAFFLPNRAKGEVIDQVYCPGDGLTLPECPYVRPGYRFIGWSDSPNGKRIHLPGDIVHVDYNISYYAQWQDSTLAVSLADDGSVSLYPNPVTDRLTITLTDATAAQVTIIDAVGRCVGQLKLTQPTTQIPTNHLPAGVYYINIATPAGLTTKHIIKR